MRKYINKLLVLCTLVAPLALVSCETDTDSNPVFHPNEGELVLNTPANAVNNTYDLANSEGIVLTTSQPAYSQDVPLATTYAVQVSLNDIWTNTDEAINFQELTSTYTTARMTVDASEINDAMVELYKAAHNDEAPTAAMPLYMRIRSYVRGGNSSQTYYGERVSNSVMLPSVLASYQAPAITLPTQLYVVGSCVGTAWSTWKPMAPVYGLDGEFYTVIYNDGSAQFKWGTYENDWRGYQGFVAVNDNAGAGVADVDGDNHNIGLTNGGWYVVHITSKINGKAIDYTLNIEPARAFVIGQVCGDTWTDSDAAWEMTAPTSKDGLWESPAFSVARDGELRAYVKVGSIDWWRTEFTVQSTGNLLYRTTDIQNSWSEATSDYATGLQNGQKLYVNFDANTGEIK
jgi:hypothetical protein